MGSAGNIVKREAEAEAEAEADPEAFVGYHNVPVAVAVPQCTLTPVRQCTPRKVETPRKVCQQVVDTHEDTVVTEDCKEVVTTVCSQTTTTHHTSNVVDTSTKVVETGVPKPFTSVTTSGVNYVHVKREADAEPFYGVHHVSRVTVPVQTSTAPDCSSTPVKTCNKTPTTSIRKVFRTVCETVVDVTNIEDCTETVTRNCQSVTTSHSSHSTVTGHELKVIN